MVPAAGVLRLRYRPKHGVRDAAMLAALLSRAVVSGVPRSELVATKEQPQACYEGVEVGTGAACTREPGRASRHSEQL